MFASGDLAALVRPAPPARASSGGRARLADGWGLRLVVARASARDHLPRPHLGKPTHPTTAAPRGGVEEGIGRHRHSAAVVTSAGSLSVPVPRARRLASGSARGRPARTSIRARGRRRRDTRTGGRWCTLPAPRFGLGALWPRRSTSPPGTSAPRASDDERRDEDQRRGASPLYALRLGVAEPGFLDLGAAARPARAIGRAIAEDRRVGAGGSSPTLRLEPLAQPPPPARCLPSPATPRRDVHRGARPRGSTVQGHGGRRWGRSG